MLPLSLAAQKDYSSLLQQFMTGQHDYFRFNGNILVAKEGKIIYRQSLGYADFNSKRKLNDSTIFELASISKQFTAMGIMMLEERRQLSYDDNLKKFFPDFPYDNITVRNLLVHTSGLPGYEEQFGKKWDHAKIAFNRDITDMLKKENDTLFFRPGCKMEIQQYRICAAGFYY